MADTIITNVGSATGDTRKSIASEATLSALLEVFKAQSGLNDKQLKELQKLGKGFGSGKDPATQAKKSFGSVSDAADALQSSLKGMPKQFEMFGDFLERGAQKPAEALGQSLKSVGGIAETVFGSKFFKYLGGGILAGAIGGVTTGLGMLAGYLQNSLETFQDLSTNGGNFSGDLLDLRRAALQGNLTLTEFSQLVKENSKLFGTIAGNVSAGAAAFSKLSLDVRTFDSKRLRTLGYTVADVNDMLADYLDIANKSSNVQNDLNNNQGKVVAGAVKFGVQLDQLSALTGINRKELAKSIKEQASRGEVTAALMRAQDRGIANVNEKFTTITAALTPFGPTVMKAAGDLLAFNGAFVTPESQALQSFMPNLADSVLNLNQAIISGTPGPEFEKAYEQNLVAMLDSRKQLIDMAQMNTEQGRWAQKFLAENASFFAKYQGKQGKALTDAIRQDVADAKRRKDMTANLTKLDEVFRNIRSKIEEKIINSKIFEKLVGYFDKFAGWLDGPQFTGIFNDLIDMFGKGLDYLTNLFTAAGREKIWNDIKETYASLLDKIKTFFSSENRQEMWNSLADALRPIFKELSDVIASGIDKGFQLVIDRIWTGGQDQTTPAARQAAGTNVPRQAAATGRTMEDIKVLRKATEEADRQLETKNIPGLGIQSRAKGGGTGQGGLFRLHANEYVLNQGMIKDLNMSFDRMGALTGTDVDDLKIGERTKTLSDFPKAEQEQIRASLESKSILQDLKDNNDLFLEMFKHHLVMQEQMQRDIGDLLDYYDKHA